MPGLPGAKICKVMDEIWLRLLTAFWGRVNEPQISQPTVNSACSKTPRSSYGRQAGVAGGYQDLVGRCSASSPADDPFVGPNPTSPDARQFIRLKTVIQTT